MKTISLAAAVALSDQDLLARVNLLARSEREATSELVAHLAALELRPSLYAAQGYEKVEKDKLGKRGQTKASPGAGRRSVDAGQPAGGTYENRIRSGTDRTASIEIVNGGVQRKGLSRHIPNAVRRAVWFRDRGQCAFVADSGHRCTERTFLELHHIQPYALKGPATIRNISLRCRRHNAYEAGLVFHRFDTSATAPGISPREAAP